MTQYKDVKVSDIFEFFPSGKIRKINNQNGYIPVLSGQKANGGIIGYTNESLIKDCSKENPYIIFGDHTRLIQIIRYPFNTTDSIRVLKIRNKFKEHINIEFFIKKWITKIPNLGYARHWKIAKNSIVEIPILQNGDFDLEKQQEIAQQYEKLEKIKDRIRIMKEDIEDKEISLENQYEGIEKNINELFFIRQGDAFYTKKRILENNWVGDIPVYSSNTKEEGLLVGIDKDNIREKDLYYQRCLTWSIDGYAGKLFVRNQDNIGNKKDKTFYFTINNHCGILLPKVEGIFLPFIKILLQHKFFERAKGYGNNKLGNNQINDITIKIPTSENGEFDLENQKEIAQKYEKIEKMKNDLIQELEYLESVKVEI